VAESDVRRLRAGELAAWAVSDTHWFHRRVEGVPDGGCLRAASHPYDLCQGSLRGGNVIVIIAKVADFDQFLRIFSTTGVEKRMEHGCKGSQMFLGPDDRNRVWVFFDWSIVDYERFLSDPEIPAIAQQLALQEPPVKAEPIARYDS
jgi:hypothetical protein